MDSNKGSCKAESEKTCWTFIKYVVELDKGSLDVVAYEFIRQNVVL